MSFYEIIIKVSYYNFPDYLIRTGDISIYAINNYSQMLFVAVNNSTN